MKNKLALGLLAFTASATMATNTLAAPAPGPSSADPSRISKKLSEEKRTPSVDDQLVIKDENAKNNVPDAEKVKFTLNSVSVSGNTVFSDEELSQFYKDKIGKEVTLAEMYLVRDAITKYYRENGYILSRAVVPAQKFGKGGAEFKIQVIEGYVHDVKVQGELKGDPDIINSYVSKIKADGPLNSADLERYLLLLNDLAGTEATATLRPAASGLGATDVIIDVTHKYVDGTVILDNSGSKYIGEFMASGELNLNSIFGLSEKITARTVFTPTQNELRFGDISWEQPIGLEGTKLRFNYGFTRSHPGSTLKPLDIEGQTNHYEAEVTHPFLRTRRENFTGRLTFAMDNTHTNSGAAEVYNDKTRVLTLGGTYDLSDNYDGVNLADLSVSQGLPILDATDANDPRSRARGDANFTRFNLEASRLQKLDDDFGLLFAMQGQYSLDALLAGEEFGVGGSDFGRGYDFSEITGDHGLAGKLELQWGIDTNTEYLQGVQLYSFYDAGTVWQRDALPGEDHRTSLTSVGIGSRLTFIDALAGYAEFSKPLTKEVAAYGDKAIQFHCGLSYLF